ncbi:TPA: hypothetical protein ACKP1B_003732 [Serratia fonticola]
MRKLLLSVLVACYSSTVYSQTANQAAPEPLTFIAKIDNIEINKTAIDGDLKLIRADRFHFKTTTPCDNDALSGRPESFGLAPKAYLEKIQGLVADILDERYFYLTVDQCNAEGQGTPMLTNIERCTESLCGAKYMQTSSAIWLNDEQQITAKRQATSVVSLPLVFDKEKQLWKITGWYIASSEETEELMPAKQIAFEGYTDDEHFKTQKFASTFTSYYASGNVQAIFNYNQQGLRDGKQQTYFDEPGKLATISSTKNGLLSGESIFYHPNGAIEAKIHYVDNKFVDGEHLYYYDDGKLQAKYAYLNNQLEGPAYVYFPNGKLKSESIYKKGKLIGKNTVYFDTGKVRAISNKNDQGQYEGANEEFDGNGNLTSKSTYENGKQLSSQNWFENGNKRSEIPYDREGRKHGIAKEWFQNGQLSKSTSYKHGVLDGDSQEWNENGQPNAFEPYKEGKRHGEVKYWNELGKLKYTTQYKNDKKHGPDRRWSVQTGKMVEEISYVEGINNGLQKTFNDRTGRVLDATPYVNGIIHGTKETYDADGVSAIECYREGQSLATLNNPGEVKSKAAKEDAQAQRQLGEYYSGCGEYGTAMKLLEKSAAQNNAEANIFLAKSYGEGIGVNQDQQKYFTYMHKAAELGSGYAQAIVAFLHLTGQNGVTINFPEAYKWNMKAAKQGIPEAHYYLGWMYANGDGVEKDVEKSKHHFTVAASAGIEDALEALKQLTSPK